MTRLYPIPPHSPTYKWVASLSRNLRGGAYPPSLHHTLHQEESSVLSVAADKRHIFSGSQGYDIYVSVDHIALGGGYMRI